MRFLPLAALCAPLLYAAPLPTVKNIQYEGLIHISPMIANEISKIKVGDVLDVQKVDRSIIEFHKQGYFEDIWVTEESGVLTYHFIEKPAIANIEINGYGSGQEQEALYKEIGIKKGDVYDESKVERARKSIMAALEKKGFYDTVVEATTEKLSDQAIKLTLDVNKGEEIIIRKVNYNGAEKLSASKLEIPTVNKEREFMGWMWGFNDGKLKVGELERDSFRMKDYYMKKGFLDAEVSPPSLLADFTTYDANLEFKISEGKIYEVSKVEIVLEEPVVEVEELMDEVRLTEGKRFNIEKLRKDMESMKEIVGDLGYAFVRITPDLDKDEENAKVRIVYYVQPGKKVKINDVLISGNTRTLDRVVRREILLAPGEMYEATKVKNSKNALKRMGYFENVEIEERRVSEDSVDLLVNVKEGRTGEFMFGIGYGSYDGLLGSVSVKDKNVFGSGMTAGVYVDKSEKESAYRINLYNPRVLDSRYSLSTNVYKRDYESYDYTDRTTGFDVVGGRYLTDHLQATLGYTIAQTELVDFVNNLEEKYKPYYHEGKYIKSSIIPGLSYDNTDDYYFPHNGIIASAYAEYAGVGGDEEFVKYFGKLAAYKSLEDSLDMDLILRYKARAGVIQENGYLPINEKFYLGGMSTIRGYKSSSVTPRDSNDVRIGGKYVFSNSAEVSYGLFETVQMRLTLFYDYGMIGQDGFNEIRRSSAGAAIEWVSPLGPINFVFPQALDDKPGDKTSSFEFTMGQRF